MLISFRKLLFASSALAPLALASALANPQGPQIVGGTASVQGTGTSTVTVTQSTDKAIINWNTFNIGAGETTKFIQPSSTSAVLNRVTGGLGPSGIYGNLSANGRVFLVNPDGILFGPNARIDTAGFLATTHDIKNDDFMAGRFHFVIPGRMDASIVNEGTITAQTGGFAALVAPGVRNSGTITAMLGTVALASGNGFTLDLYGDRLITLTVADQIATTVKDVATGQPLDTLVKNAGLLSATGGRVELTAAAARQVVDSVINTSGVVEANSIGTKNGMIVLSAATESSKPLGVPTQKVKVSGTLSVAGKNAGETGGKIQVSGEAIELTAATLDASGRAGGGRVLVGGDTGGGVINALVAPLPQAQLESTTVATASTVVIDAASTINVSALDGGIGGKAVAWADQAMSFYGTIIARGGATSGNGGFVETSGYTLDVAGIKVDASAANGKAGYWLLDPSNLTIDAAAAATISNTLSTTSVLVMTSAGGTKGPGTVTSGSGDIIVASNISWGSGSTLSLSAYRDISFNSGATVTSSGFGSMFLTADNTGSGTGRVNFSGPGANVIANGGGFVLAFYNPATFGVPDIATSSVSVSGGGAFTPFMLVNTPTQLQNVSSNLSGNYALGRDIDMSGFGGFVPIGNGSPFTGQFTGQLHTISNLTLNSGASLVGLFSSIDGGVGNLNLLNFNVALNAVTQAQVGAVAGVNSGIVVNVHLLSGSVTGNQNNAVGCGGSFCGVGGLVGTNTGQVVFSSSAAAVTGGRDNSVGGLVGKNNGVIFQSFASGAVLNNGLAGEAGGLVGWNQGGTISYAYALGSAGNADGRAGGLIALNDLGGTVSQAYAAGAVSGATPGGLVAGTGFGGQNVSNSYWDIQTTGQSTSSAGTGLTTSQAKQQSSYLGWDFPSVWAISTSVNSGYPYLIANPPSLPSTFGGSGPTTISLPSSSFDYFSNQQTKQFTAPSIDWQMAQSTPSVLPSINTQPASTLTNSQTTTSTYDQLRSVLSGIQQTTNNTETVQKVLSLVEAVNGQDPSKVSYQNGYIYPAGYNGDTTQCVALVRALDPKLSPDSGATGNWTTEGSTWVDSSNLNLKPGTALATFDAQGNYVEKHAVIFLGYYYEGGVAKGMYWLDQNNPSTGNTKGTAEIRLRSFADMPTLQGDGFAYATVNLKTSATQ